MKKKPNKLVRLIPLIAIFAVCWFAFSWGRNYLQQSDLRQLAKEHREVALRGDPAAIEFLDYVYVTNTDVGRAHLLANLGLLDFIDLHRGPLGFTNYKRIWRQVAEAAFKSPNPLLAVIVIENQHQQRRPEVCQRLLHHSYDVLDKAIGEEDYETAYFASVAIWRLVRLIINAYDDKCVDGKYLANVSVDPLSDEASWLLQTTVLAHWSDVSHPRIHIRDWSRDITSEYWATLYLEHPDRDEENGVPLVRAIMETNEE